MIVKNIKENMSFLPILFLLKGKIEMCVLRHLEISATIKIGYYTKIRGRRTTTLILARHKKSTYKADMFVSYTIHKKKKKKKKKPKEYVLERSYRVETRKGRTTCP
jgi:hypothetical protein